VDSAGYTWRYRPLLVMHARNDDDYDDLLTYRKLSVNTTI